jgi:hypothetical protein
VPTRPPPPLLDLISSTPPPLWLLSVPFFSPIPLDARRFGNRRVEPTLPPPGLMHMHNGCAFGDIRGSTGFGRRCGHLGVSERGDEGAGRRQF